MTAVAIFSRRSGNGRMAADRVAQTKKFRRGGLDNSTKWSSAVVGRRRLDDKTLRHVSRTHDVHATTEQRYVDVLHFGESFYDGPRKRLIKHKQKKQILTLAEVVFDTSGHAAIVRNRLIIILLSC